MPDTVSEECESERRHTQDLLRCVGCAVDGVGLSGLILLLTRSLVPHVHRHVVPRIAGVASVADVTQIDVDDVEGHSAVAPTLLDSLAEDLFEAHPDTNLRDVGRIGGQILPSAHRDADVFSSASSESCWGEREDIGDEEVEWGALPPPSGQADDIVSLREGDHDRPRVRRLHLISSQSVAPASSSPQRDYNRFAAVPHNSESGFFGGRTWCTSARQGSRCPVIPWSTHCIKIWNHHLSGTPVTPLVRQLSTVVFISGRTGSLH